MNVDISIYLAVGIVAWLAAQISKYVLSALTNKRLTDTNKLFLSGGMPSAHSATTVAMLTAIGLNEGVNSSIFAVMAILTAIVVYDAVMVRRSSGEQGEALVSLMIEQKSKVKKPFVAKGHSLYEVVAGSALGAIVAIAIMSL